MSPIIPSISRSQMLCPFGLFLANLLLLLPLTACITEEHYILFCFLKSPFNGFYVILFLTSTSNLDVKYQFIWSLFGHPSEMMKITLLIFLSTIPTREFLFSFIYLSCIPDSQALLVGSFQVHAGLTHLVLSLALSPKSHFYLFPSKNSFITLSLI